MASIRCFCPLCATSAPTLTITGTPCGSQYSACRSAAGRFAIFSTSMPSCTTTTRPAGMPSWTRMSRMAPEAAMKPSTWRYFHCENALPCRWKSTRREATTLGRGTGAPNDKRQRRHRDGMRIVRVHDRRLPLPDDPRQLPRRREIDLVHRRERHQVGALGRASIELTLGVRDQHRPMAPRPQAEHGQEDLLLSSAPRARGVDVEGEHSSQSFANLRPTYRAFMAETISPGTPSRKPPRSR